MIFTLLFLFYMIFGLVFYDLPMFQMVDEFFPFLLFGVSIFQKKRISKSLLYVGCFFLLYLAYSFFIKSNLPRAIFFDFICCIKPFVTYYSVLALKPDINPKHKKIIKYVVISFVWVLVYAGIRSFGVQTTNKGELLTGARLGFCCIYLAITYYLFSSHRTEDFWIMMIISSIGFFIPTSKFVATIFVIISVFLLTKRSKIKISLKSLVVVTLTICIVVMSAIEDFNLYLSTAAARGVMYITTGLVLLDYIPFGSGLASFGSPASSTFYSNLYYKYGLDNVYGLSPDKPDFVSDAFYPILAEFGFVGVVFFIIFIISLFRKIQKGSCRYNYRLSLIIILSILIESVSDVSLIGNRGVYAMLLLGYMVSNRKELRNARKD